jgi:hypothetical protein
MIRKQTIATVIAAACLANIVGSVNGQENEKKTPAKLASYAQSAEDCPPGELPAYANSGYGAGYAGYAGYPANTPKAFGQSWGSLGNSRDCNRFYHYPYVFYPQNFQSSDYYRSSDSMYYRYPPEMQIPVYNRNWHNYYPSQRRYHSGHHFLTDVF